MPEIIQTAVFGTATHVFSKDISAVVCHDRRNMYEIFVE
jgi:hypothetical protein